MPALRFVLLAMGLLMIGADALASTEKKPRRGTVTKEVTLVDVNEPKIHAYELKCRKGLTAVAGAAEDLAEETVVVTSRAIADDTWLFEFINYGGGFDAINLYVQCVEGEPSPRHLRLVLRSWSLPAGETRRQEVQGPRSTSRLGFLFRARSAAGGPPSQGARLQVYDVRPTARGYTFRVQNQGDFPLKMQTGGVFIRNSSTNTRTGRTVLSRARIVSFARTAQPGQTINASRRCPAGSTAAGSSLALPTPDLRGSAVARGDGFRFQVFNNSDVSRRVRLYGICLSEQIR